MAPLWASLFLCLCVLHFAKGHGAAIDDGTWLEAAGKGQRTLELSSESSPNFKKPGVGKASQGPVAARRELAARLGATKRAPPVKDAVKGAVHPQDAAALLRALAQWNGAVNTVDSRRLLSTWNVRRPCSQWFGVSCDTPAGRVTAIRLPGLGGVNGFFSLGGPFPAELGSLPELRSLILARNDLGANGTLVLRQWTRLKKLAHLDLSGNGYRFDGGVNLPEALFNLTSLTYLNLAGIRRAGALPKSFKRLSQLAWLDLSDEGLRDADIDVLGSVTSLRSLFLRQSLFALQSTDLISLSRLQRLEQLDLSGYGAREDFPAFLKALSHLASLRLNFAFDPDAPAERAVSVPSWIGSLLQLTSLDLSYSGLSGSLPTQLGHLPKLARLLLGHNRVRGNVPQGLLNSSSLTQLDLSQNKLSLTGVSVGPGAKLKVLDLSQNGLAGPIPKALSPLKSLQSLSLSGNRLAGTIPQFLWAVSSLTSLDLSKNVLTGFGLSSSLKVARRLKRLDLSHNKLQGTIPAELSTLTGLTNLNLAQNSFTGIIPAWLGRVRGLRILSLNINQLTGTLPSSIFQKGRVLDLSTNWLSGRLPPSGLKAMAEVLEGLASDVFSFGFSVDISGNYFTGPCYSPSNSISCVPDPFTDVDDCISYVSGGMEEILGRNCFQSCSNPLALGLQGPEQRSAAVCSHFCGSDKPNGPCGGHGFCSLKGPKKTPTCTCKAGFVAPASKPGTCVPKESH